MHLHEFELRYRAYKGLNYKFNLGWDNETILQMTKISLKGILTKAVQEINPQELQEITLETYTQDKKNFLLQQGEKNIGFGTLQEYIQRLEYEMKVIKEMGFNSYFLIVADFIRRAKKNTIMVGPGRGSGAGSLLAWLVRITDIDPLQFGLLFERFLNPARISMPDFDIDFEDVQREKVIEYVTQKYGQAQVSGIGTYMQMASKAAFKDVARVLGVPFEKSNQVSSLMHDKMSLSETVKAEDGLEEELKALYNTDEKIRQAADLSEKLEGNMRQLGVHACGIIIAPDKVSKFSPTQYVREDDHTIVSQYDGPTMETIGLLKMDFLGLRNLSIIKNCIKILQKKYASEEKELPQMFVDFFESTSFQPPIDDMFTFEKVFQSGDTTGIFQFESNGMRRFLIQLKPDSMNDLVAMNALYRPGPMEFIPNYIARKNKEEPVEYMTAELRKMLIEKYGEEETDKENIRLVEDLSPIMNITYGIPVYQEQLMFIVQSMAGFSLADADLLRRGVGKKKKEIIEKLKKEFTHKAKDFRDYKKETAIYIYEKMIEPAASYSFNKSHSVCYAMIAYQTAYLKAYYPVEFYASLIRSVEEDADELSVYVYQAQNQGIQVLPPDINQSFNHVAAIQNEIRLGFLCIKGLGRDIGETIQEERKKNGPYQSLENFIKRCSAVINKKSLEGLIKSGGLDGFGERGMLLSNTENILERSKKSKETAGGLFGSAEIASTISLKNKEPATTMEKLMMEQEVFKSFVSGHPLDGLYLYLKKYNFISQFKEKEGFGSFIIVGYIKNIQRAKKKGFFIQIEDISGQIEFFVKEVLDFKKFDIIILQGFKGRSISIEKIIKTTIPQLQQQAGGKRDPTMTVVKAKGLRNKTEPKNDLPEPQTSISSPTPEPTTETEDVNDTSSESFKLPDNANKLNALVAIIQAHPGSNYIKIGNKQFQLDDIGVQKVQDLYKAST
ncbi:MAG: DNA polymerase III subunit alpha [candidate division SR1 bacterium]|nr:DNA polymerase III subunit alpha [candidate division SR1 bacterium]